MASTKKEQSIPELYIAGHRGMGISAKRRDAFIHGAVFYPENSIAAFREAIRCGAEALECDIHVSKDNVAMVLHGEKITDYAYYLSAEDEKPFMCPNSKDMCRDYACSEIQHQFVLKGPVEYYTKNVLSEDLTDDENDQQKQEREIQLREAVKKARKDCTDTNTYRIPTLTELLTLVAEENQKEERHARPLLLNIELKGFKSGFISLHTIMNFNASQLAANQPTIAPAHIVLLGRISIGEIVIAKNIIQKGDNVMAKIAKGEEIGHDILSQIASGERELRRYESQHDWRLIFAKNIKDISDILMADTSKSIKPIFPAKTIIFVESNQCYFCLGDKLARYGSPENYSVTLKGDMILDDLEIDFGEKKWIDPVASTSISLDTVFAIKQAILDKVDPEFLCKYASIEQKNTSGKVFEFINSFLQPTKKSKELKSVQEERVTKCLSQMNQSLCGIRTNVMLSTGELYGELTLLPGSEDFDIKPGVMGISNNGVSLLNFCFEGGYDGIDISLFDVDELIIERINHFKNHSQRDFIMGVTAANWKGTTREGSPTKPFVAVMMALELSKRLGMDILMKVDEPGFFKIIKETLLSHPMVEGEETYLETTNMARASSLAGDEDMRRSHELRVLGVKNYDMRNTHVSLSSFFPVVKPARGDQKKVIEYPEAVSNEDSLLIMQLFKLKQLSNVGKIGQYLMSQIEGSTAVATLDILEGADSKLRQNVLEALLPDELNALLNIIIKNSAGHDKLRVDAQKLQEKSVQADTFLEH